MFAGRKALIFPRLVLVVGLLFVGGTAIGQFFFPPLAQAPSQNIVYLVANESADSLVTPAKLQSELNATIVSSWDQFLSLNQTAGQIDVLIIDDSAFPLVDRLWANSAYRQGVVIAGFDITGTQMAELVGDACIAEGDFAKNMPNYVIVSFSASGDNSAEVSQAVERSSQDCTGEQPIEGITERVDLSRHRSSDVLTDESYFNQFSNMLVSHFND